MTIGEIWYMETAVMGAYESVDHLDEPDVINKAFGMVMRWRELQVNLLLSMAANRESKVDDLATIEFDHQLSKDEEMLAKIAWANIEQGMIELQGTVPGVEDAKKIERFMNGDMD